MMTLKNQLMVDKTMRHIDLIKDADFDFELPKPLESAIHDLENAIEQHSMLIDCYQDEIRSCSRYLDDEDKENKVIDFFCRRRW
jgi:hypothetical protein